MYRVMLIDDDKNIIQGLQRCISWEELGFQVAYAESDPAAALERLRQNRVELLVTDISMPELSGLELIAKVRQFYAPEVILLSGYNEFSFAKRAIELGVSQYLLKPIETDELKKALTAVRSKL